MTPRPETKRTSRTRRARLAARVKRPSRGTVAIHGGPSVRRGLQPNGSAGKTDGQGRGLEPTDGRPRSARGQRLSRGAGQQCREERDPQDVQSAHGRSVGARTADRNPLVTRMLSQRDHPHCFLSPGTRYTEVTDGQAVHRRLTHEPSGIPQE